MKKQVAKENNNLQTYLLRPMSIGEKEDRLKKTYVH